MPNVSFAEQQPPTATRKQGQTQSFQTIKPASVIGERPTRMTRQQQAQNARNKKAEKHVREWDQRLDRMGMAAQGGVNHDLEIPGDLSKFDDTERVSQSFSYWAVGEDVAMLMASEISGHRLTYTEGRPARFWPNTEETHVNYRGKTVGGLI